MASEIQLEAVEGLTLTAFSTDADVVENAMTQAYRAGLCPEFVPPLLALLGLPWHTRHEDVVLALQQLKDPRAVNALRAAAVVEHEYLAYDENFGLARKCTWALADIGTPEARSALEEMARTGHPHLAAYAAQRLDRWNQELGRKGTAPGR